MQERSFIRVILGHQINNMTMEKGIQGGKCDKPESPSGIKHGEKMKHGKKSQP